MEVMDYYYATHSLPQAVVVDMSFEVRRLQSFFGHYTEDIVRRIIDAIGDRHAYSYNVTRLTADIYDGLYTASSPHGRPQEVVRIGLFDMMITLEQMALSMQEKLAQHNLYIVKQFLPFLFEHILSDGSVVLTRLAFEDFCDAYCVELNR